MSYKILPYSYNQASKLGVSIRSSTRKNKKIDVFKDNVYITSIGQLGMMDYPTYIQHNGISYAEERRKLYKQRHKKDDVVGTRGYYALHILW